MKPLCVRQINKTTGNKQIVHTVWLRLPGETEIGSAGEQPIEG